MYSSLGAKQTASTIGGLAVGVPGELRGWQMLHHRHGRLNWSELFQPAINYARNGFVVNVDLAGILNSTSTSGFMVNDTLWSETYRPNGTFAKQGDTIYRKRYADTLEAIAQNGVDYF